MYNTDHLAFQPPPAPPPSSVVVLQFVPCKHSKCFLGRLVLPCRNNNLLQTCMQVVVGVRRLINDFDTANVFVLSLKEP